MLLALGPAEVEAGGERVSWRGPIRGGLLARRPGGALALEQSGAGRPQLSVAVSGFVPRLGVLYGPLQHPFHVAVSRRWLRRLSRGGAA